MGDITSNLELHYPFETGSGTTATDASGNARHGTISGATWAAGKVGDYCLSFDGTDDWVETSTVFSFGTAGSVAWWQNPNTAHNTSSTNGRRPWSQMTLSGAPALSLDGFLDNNIYAGFLASGDDDRVVVANSSTYWTSGTWNHWALTWTIGGDTKLYNNGSLIGTKSGGTTANWGSTSFRIARFGTADGAAFHFNGKIDDFRVYSRTLAVGDIADLVALGSGGGGSRLLKLTNEMFYGSGG